MRGGAALVTLSVRALLCGLLLSMSKAAAEAQDARVLFNRSGWWPYRWPLTPPRCKAGQRPLFPLGPPFQPASPAKPSIRSQKGRLSQKRVAKHGGGLDDRGAHLMTTTASRKDCLRRCLLVGRTKDSGGSSEQGMQTSKQVLGSAASSLALALILVPSTARQAQRTAAEVLGRPAAGSPAEVAHPGIQSHDDKTGVLALLCRA